MTSACKQHSILASRLKLGHASFAYLWLECASLLEVLVLSLPLQAHSMVALTGLQPFVRLTLTLTAWDGDNATPLLRGLRGVQPSVLMVVLRERLQLAAVDNQLTLIMHATEPAERLRALLPGVV